MFGSSRGSWFGHNVGDGLYIISCGSWFGHNVGHGLYIASHGSWFGSHTVTHPHAGFNLLFPIVNRFRHHYYLNYYRHL